MAGRVSILVVSLDPSIREPLCPLHADAGPLRVVCVDSVAAALTHSAVDLVLVDAQVPDALTGWSLLTGLGSVVGICRGAWPGPHPPGEVLEPDDLLSALVAHGAGALAGSDRHALDLALANEELEAFAHSAAHDLRTPLRTIHSFLEMLMADLEGQLDAPQLGLFGRVTGAADRLGQLLDALLRHARVRRTEIQRLPVDLAPPVRRLFDELRACEPHRSAALTVAAELCAEGDPTLLELAIHNLVSNAWKFTRGRPETRIQVGRHASGSFFVRDNGVGFESHRAARLFRPFNRLHRQSEFEGTGLGLATVMQVVRRHHGWVRASSRVGVGSVFSFGLYGDGGLPLPGAACRESPATSWVTRSSTTPSGVTCVCALSPRPAGPPGLAPCEMSPPVGPAQS
jgi:signal transduction histidine kinase